MNIGRFVTAMLYLTGDLAGGRTIFPVVDVGISPEAGALLYWSTKEYLCVNKGNFYPSAF